MRELTRSAAVVAAVIILGTASGVSMIEPRQAAQQDPHDAAILIMATAADSHSRWERTSRDRSHHAHDSSARNRSGNRNTAKVGVDATAGEASTGGHAVVQPPVRAGFDVVLRDLPGVETGQGSCS